MITLSPETTILFVSATVRPGRYLIYDLWSWSNGSELYRKWSVLLCSGHLFPVQYSTATSATAQWKKAVLFPYIFCQNFLDKSRFEKEKKMLKPFPLQTSLRGTGMGSEKVPFHTPPPPPRWRFLDCNFIYFPLFLSWRPLRWIL